MTTISPPKKINPPQMILLAVFALVMAAVLTVAVQTSFTSRAPGMNDFMSRWEGARSFFVDGVSPYSEQASLNIQLRIYGRPVQENEDPGFFVYPFYTAFVVWPLVYLPYSWASAVWMVVLMAALIGATLLVLHIFGWKPSVGFLFMLIFWSLAYYYAARGLLLGQPSHLVYFLVTLSLWGLIKRHDAVGGAALAVATLKPQMGYLIVPFLLLWALRQKRWTFIGWFAGVFGALMAASFVLQPDWFGDWIAQVRLYPEYTAAAYPSTGSPVWIVTQYYLQLGDFAEMAVNGLFYGLLAWVWYTVLLQNRRERFLWGLMMTIAITNIVALRTATPHFVLFNIAVIFYCWRIQQTKSTWSTAASWGILLALLILPWVHFLATVSETLEHESLFLPLPLIMITLLLITRKVWWSHSLSMEAQTAS